MPVSAVVAVQQVAPSPSSSSSSSAWACCVVVPAADAFADGNSKDTGSKQQQRQQRSWKWWKRQQPRSRGTTQQQQDLQQQPPPSAAAKPAHAAAGSGGNAKAAGLHCQQPAVVSALTSSSLAATAIGQRAAASLAAPAGAQHGYQRCSTAGIRQDNTGDSPSELHSDLRAHVPSRAPSSSCTRVSWPDAASDAACSSCCGSQGSLPGAAAGDDEAAAGAASAASCSRSQAQPHPDGTPCPDSSSDAALLVPPSAAAVPSSAAACGQPAVKPEPSAGDATAGFRDVSQLSSASSSLPSNLHLQQLQSGTSFRMLLSSGELSISSSGPAARGLQASAAGAAASSDAAAAKAAAPAAAAAAGMVLRKSSSTLSVQRAASSPFAHLPFQQSIADSLVATPQQEQLLPSTSSAAGPGVAAAVAAAAAAAAATLLPSLSSGGRTSSSSGGAAGPPVFAAAAGPAGAAAASPRFQPVASRRSASRISWGASSVTLLERDVFDVLDPETSSACSGHRILKHSASASSLSSSAGGGTGGTGGTGSAGSSGCADRQLQLRGAFSTSALGSLALGRPAAAADLSETGSTAGSAVQRFKNVLRKSTEQLSSISFISREATADTSPTGTRHRRSKSDNHLCGIDGSKQQQQQDELGTFAGSAQVAGGTSGGTGGDNTRLLPPLPRASLISAFSSSQLSSPAFSPLVQSSSSNGHQTPPSNSSGFSSSAGSGGSHAGNNSSASGRRLGSAAALQQQALLPSLDSQSTGSSSACSLASTGLSGTLVATAVGRMHLDSLPACASAGEAAGAASSHSGGVGGRALRAAQTAAAPAGSSLASTSSASSSCVAAKAFAQAFLAALAAGNTKWASDAAVAGLLHETAKMVGLDKQVYAGKTAIIRRLNSGMEQLMKMVQAYVADQGSGNGSSGDGSSPAGALEALSGRLPEPLLSVSCPEPAAKPSLAVATYTFKMGMRKFTLRDEFIVKGGQIVRLRRARA